MSDWTHLVLISVLTAFQQHVVSKLGLVLIKQTKRDFYKLSIYYNTFQALFILIACYYLVFDVALVVVAVDNMDIVDIVVVESFEFE